VNGEPQLNSTQYMVVIARGMTDEQAREASEWFAALDPLPWVEVVETDTVPRTYVSRGYMRLAWPDGAEEPIGNRIVELPQDVERQRLRDPHSGTIAYVPTGSIEEGASLVNEGGGGRTTQCSICHGPDLKGLAEIPSIAGRSPTYIFRQLYSFKDGSRGGASAALMQPAVTSLEESDMIAIAAYLATLEP
jgi:cytochrome c553